MSDASEQAGLAPGDTLAEKYVVERVIGQGGMGVVVAARHRELDARVAVKVLRTRPAPSVDAVERFQREARAAARLKSDHVARVNDVGVLSDGTPFMVLEYLEGADLAELVRGGPLAPGMVAELVAQACEAVAEAHAQGIVHRDLKPSNLFVTRTVRGSARVKVLDFGISKLRGGGAEPLAETAQGTMLGTPLYMSPEQMRSSRDVDARSDVWSLGLVAFELLTGQVPWSTASITALAVDVTTMPAPDPRTLRPEIPTDLAAVVLRCLEKEPAARYADAAELGAALAPFRAEASTASTDALLARAPGGRRMVEDAATTPAATPTPAVPATRPAATPAPASRNEPQTKKSASRDERLVVGAVVGVGLLAFASMYVVPALLSVEEAPAPAASIAPTEAPAIEGVDAGAAPVPLAIEHPRPCVAEPTPPCASETSAWCLPEGTRVACCGPGLVPTIDGFCECPPGGATDEAALASGCAAPIAGPDVRARIRALIQSNLDTFRYCYERTLVDSPRVQGQVTLAFTISPWGELWSPRLDGSSLPSADVQRCVVDALGALRLDPPLPGSMPVDVTYPIVFEHEE